MNGKAFPLWPWFITGNLNESLQMPTNQGGRKKDIHFQRECHNSFILWNLYLHPAHTVFISGANLWPHPAALPQLQSRHIGGGPIPISTLTKFHSLKLNHFKNVFKKEIQSATSFNWLLPVDLVHFINSHCGREIGNGYEKCIE